MPSWEVVNLLPIWIERAKESLIEFHVLCKATSHITDQILETIAPYTTHLQRLQVAGCPRVTHKGINAILSQNDASIKVLALEGLSPSFELSALSHCNEKLTTLKSLTLTLPSNTTDEAWSTDFLAVTRQAYLEELNLYLSTSMTSKTPVELSSNVFLSITAAHSSSLRRFSLSRFQLPPSVIGAISESCQNLESLFVMVKASSLLEIAPQLARSRSLRNIHVNFPHTDQTGRIPPSLVLEIASQLGSQVQQLGFLNRVYKLQRVPKVNDANEVILDLVLAPYDQPEIPEQFLVLRA